MTRPLLAALAAATLLSAPAGKAAAADLTVYHENDGSVCADAGVLKRITSRFGYQVRNVPNLPQVGIVDFQNIHLNRYEPTDEFRQIERTYCRATVGLSDGHARPIWYLIEGRMGFASIGEGVEFCVSGFDRWLVYNGGCRVLQ